MMRAQGVSEEDITKFIQQMTQPVIEDPVTLMSRLPQDIQAKVAMMKSQDVDMQIINDFIHHQSQSSENNKVLPDFDTLSPVLQRKVAMLKQQGVDMEAINAFVLSQQNQDSINISDLPDNVQDRVMEMKSRGYDKQTINQFIEKQRMMLQQSSSRTSGLNPENRRNLVDNSGNATKFHLIIKSPPL